MQTGWMRLRLCPAPPLSSLTRPGYTRIGFLPAHLVRVNSSVQPTSRPAIPKHRMLRKPGRSTRPAARDSVPTNLQANRTSYALEHIQSRGLRNGWAGPSRSAAHLQANHTRHPRNSSKNNAPVGLTMERANSRNTLYKNLLRLLSSGRTFPLPVLLDYHELHPDFRSVQSYNLLIQLAIRHVAYGTVQSLLQGMANDKIPANLETQKLKTRWFVRSGLWEHAWIQVTATYPNPIPLPLWLEFLHGTKEGALAMGPSVIEDVAKSPLERFQTLMQNPPVFTPNSVKSSVRTVRIVARAMLALRRPQSAFTLATRYFTGLPRHIGQEWGEQCVAIIDGIVAFEAQKKGLLDFYTARRKLNSLLALHPTFRPTSKTLYLLLGTLRQAKQCGTVSWHTLTKFKTRWGPEVENRRVRRRVASYAVIEQRLDIVNKVFDAERASRLLEAGTKRQRQRKQQRGPKPLAETFARHGYEERLWKSLEGRARKLGLKLRAQKERADGDSII
ncbi:hypothetical protein B0H17DRAFT_973351 [Mycena rosella]|uniref:Uncharacterized protein n=1 Tax=Mycena rosella TaxID=1033263 RepID=A0AAD7M8V8_MYCRO|nr:hypothetical protein B0H17DRAFT_973351 [Mycena rosella]